MPLSAGTGSAGGGRKVLAANLDGPQQGADVVWEDPADRADAEAVGARDLAGVDYELKVVEPVGERGEVETWIGWVAERSDDRPLKLRREILDEAKGPRAGE